MNSLPHGSEITFGDEYRDADFVAVVAACQEFNFAVVRGIVLPQDQSGFSKQTTALTHEFYTRQETTVHSNGSRVSLARTAIVANMSDLHPSLISPIVGIIRGLNETAARMQGIDRIPHEGKHPSVTNFGVNSFAPNQYIGSHIDDEDGVAVAINAEGVGLAELWTEYPARYAKTTLERGDGLVLPARYGAYQHADTRTMHQVTNITPVSRIRRNSGIRRSLAFTYDDLAG